MSLCADSCLRAADLQAKSSMSSPGRGQYPAMLIASLRAAGLHATSSVRSLGQGLALLVRIDHLLTMKLHWAVAFQAFSS